MVSAGMEVDGVGVRPDASLRPPARLPEGSMSIWQVSRATEPWLTNDIPRPEWHLLLLMQQEGYKIHPAFFFARFSVCALWPRPFNPHSCLLSLCLSVTHRKGLWKYFLHEGLSTVGPGLFLLLEVSKPYSNDIEEFSVCRWKICWGGTENPRTYETVSLKSFLIKSNQIKYMFVYSLPQYNTTLLCYCKLL